MCLVPAMCEPSAWSHAGHPGILGSGSFLGTFRVDAALVCQLQTPCWDSHLTTGRLDPFSHSRVRSTITRGAGIEEPPAVGGAQAGQNQALGGGGGAVVATVLRSWNPCAHFTDCVPLGCDWVTPFSSLIAHIRSEVSDPSCCLHVETLRSRQAGLPVVTQRVRGDLRCESGIYTLWFRTRFGGGRRGLL